MMPIKDERKCQKKISKNVVNKIAIAIVFNLRDADSMLPIRSDRIRGLLPYIQVY